MKQALRIIQFAFAATLAVGFVGGCKSTALMSRADEIKVGQQASTEVEKQYRLDPNPRDQEVVRTIGQKILASNKMESYPYTFKVLDSKEVNAVSLPGGPVYVFKGLLDLTEGDQDEMAAVIGHEMGHVNARHIAKMYTQGFWLSLIIGLGTRGQAQDLARLGEMIATLHFSREDEYEADRLGIKYSYNAGYDPNGAVRFFQKLQRLEGSKGNDLDAIMRTHPLTKDRIDRAKKEIARLSPQGQNK